MSIEVERKFALGDAHAALQFREAVARCGGVWQPPVTQVDVYYAHPQRNFAVTDEALRIRQDGEASEATYKGPKLDATTKTRREITVALVDDVAAAQLAELFEALGFRAVAEVRKTRSKAELTWRDFALEIACDEVEPLGWFAEIEVVVDESDVETARQALAELVAQLQLAGDERRSYLELMLAAGS
ncbi:MAG: class IV adenylate cyclase [Planctomycetota bacterium]|nr:MAG: class IV adenylate cyclase [Planctomycetota bacterium]REJ91373.1 MAG: class IV adenylate cyclase [Planctomycetota bacterium]REK18507.1 MAG: class IV adenylate cyclase [Planctomycetota bacterium]REK39433.1 MAG: class IV adenylate cyclase [Planctomycetota bacterium]